MDIQKKINSLTLKEKIAQMFIMGFSGSVINDDNINILKVIKSGLGGIIFFADNIESHDQIKNLITDLQNAASIPLFTSIDQEGGLVERTINIKERTDYLTPMALASTGNPDNIKLHTHIMTQELKYIGINMNFTPVLDVNTNQNNPVIGIRALSNNTDEVIKFSKSVYKTFQENDIIPVGKHFPGHGEAGIDSHIDMPSIEMDIDKLEEIHIKPFKTAIQNNLDAIMIAHVNYSAFNKDSKIPASLSKEVITDYLKDKLDFKGLIISDDMDMGGITKHYDHIEACIMAINAGVDLFIFRDSSDENLELIDKLVMAANNNAVLEDRINESFNKILKFKEKYSFFAKEQASITLNIKENQSKIDKIALESIKVIKKGDLLPLESCKNFLILSPDKSQIFNYSKDKGSLGEFLKSYFCKELFYSLNPERLEIQSIKQKLENFDSIIFLSYNALINQGQIELLNSIILPVIAVAVGSPYDVEIFDKADSIIQTCCYKRSSLMALAMILNEVE
ncbi:MAG: glycoside hydrolase family 3 protein [Candidatus Gastranaerophilales bacterium]|nr:glycoside hydrolase family 3 protein [Candidatus Gastranaerophilales bacterium]